MGVAQGSDEVLVRQMQSADPVARSEAWRAWYEQDRPALMRYIRRRCPAHCEDILQECFEKGFIKVASGQYEHWGKPLIAYLKGIARNLIHTEYRSVQRTISLIVESDDGQEYDLPLAAEGDMDAVGERLDQESEGRRVMAALAELDEQKRSVLVKRFLQSKSARKTGEEMGMSPGYVRVETHRALKALREIFEQTPPL